MAKPEFDARLEVQSQPFITKHVIDYEKEAPAKDLNMRSNPIKEKVKFLSVHEAHYQKTKIQGIDRSHFFCNL